jgi:hypothetical protein
MQLRPVRYRILVERLHNRRITLLREEADGGYNLCFETCLTPADAAERLAEATADGKVLQLRRGRILVTRLALSKEALEALCKMFQHHEHAAEHRRMAKNRKQQLILARMDTLANAAIDADLRPAPHAPATPAPKPPRKPRKPRE